jgi:hypothetical protein
LRAQTGESKLTKHAKKNLLKAIVPSSSYNIGFESSNRRIEANETGEEKPIKGYRSETPNPKPKP